MYPDYSVSRESGTFTASLFLRFSPTDNDGKTLPSLLLAIIYLEWKNILTCGFLQMLDWFPGMILKKKLSFPVTGSDQKTLFSRKKCQNFEKLTKIYQKSEYPFQIAYHLNFHFPKKVNFSTDRKKCFLFPVTRSDKKPYFHEKSAKFLKNWHEYTKKVSAHSR